MSDFFRDWKEAHAHAQAKADRLGLDVAIRATREYGRKGFAVHLASRNDSDYAIAEIVKPAAGKEWKRNPGGTRMKRRNSPWTSKADALAAYHGRTGYTKAEALAILRKYAKAGEWEAVSSFAPEAIAKGADPRVVDSILRGYALAIKGAHGNPAKHVEPRLAQAHHEAEERRYHALPSASSCRDIAGGRDVEKNAAYAHGAAAKLWSEVTRYAPSRSEKALRAQIRKAEKASGNADQADADYRACREQIEALKARIAARRT
mgnify:CR=1 FL=1